VTQQSIVKQHGNKYKLFLAHLLTVEWVRPEIPLIITAHVVTMACTKPCVTTNYYIRPIHSAHHTSTAVHNYVNGVTMTLIIGLCGGFLRYVQHLLLSWFSLRKKYLFMFLKAYEYNIQILKSIKQQLMNINATERVLLLLNAPNYVCHRIPSWLSVILTRRPYPYALDHCNHQSTITCSQRRRQNSAMGRHIKI